MRLYTLRNLLLLALKRSILWTCLFLKEFTRVVYHVCSPTEVQKLYDQYERTFEDYISSKVLPSLRGKENENLLRELLRRWSNHITMTYWLFRFFHYLSRHCITHRKLPSLEEVYAEFNDGVRDAIVSLIDREREGEQIDSAIVKQVVDIYKKLNEKIGESKLERNTKDLEEAITKSTTMFYSRKASDWIANMSYENYMLKVEECLEREQGRAFDYIRFGSKNKVLEVVKHELLVVHASKLDEKKHLHDAVA